MVFCHSPIDMRAVYACGVCVRKRARAEMCLRIDRRMTNTQYMMSVYCITVIAELRAWSALSTKASYHSSLW